MCALHERYLNEYGRYTVAKLDMILLKTTPLYTNKTTQVSVPLKNDTTFKHEATLPHLMFRNQHNPVGGNDFAAGIHWSHIIPGITLMTQTAWETQFGSGMVRERRWDGQDEGISQEYFEPVPFLSSGQEVVSFGENRAVSFLRRV
ncbi:hypothetical protein FB45DRAFT_873257 [Roridomyces roridus]|uniref:Uncharacterized protein n=1 Tax=Roridomyces roridus TaxID=1738132 RepID=A0AAD7FFP0_9AGAR|nr:hypothetical protein FB45DRAFT_873257 [Roridomyces roridus]